MYKKLNFAAGVLASGIANDAVEITLKEGHTITTDTGETNKFIGVFFDKAKSSPFHDATREIVEAYRTNTNVFTIARAKEGTDAKAWVEDDNFMLIASSAVFDEYEDAINTKAPKASPEFTGDVTLENSKWLKSKDYSGAGYINILKGTIDDEVDIGAQLNVGTIEADSDAGAVALFDMPVSDASDDGAEMSVAIRIDANDILKVYAEADGEGGADSFAVKLLSGAGLDITETAATSDTDKFLVSDSKRVKYRTGAEVLSDIGGQALLGFTPENVANKKTTITDSDTDYPTGKAVKTAVDAKAPLDSPTFATSITGSYLTASEILITDADKKIVSAPVATYPSLTELSYVKGVTSGIQSQLGNKAPSASPTLTGTVTLPKAVNIKDTSADHEYQLGVSELAANRTVTLPLLTGNDEFTFNAHTQTLTNKTLGTGSVVNEVTMSLGSDADGDIYYRSSNKLARLPKGTASQVLTMNSGATAPEWADAGGGSDTQLLTAVVTLSSADILALNTSPKTILSSPGADKVIIIEQVVTYFDYGTTQYTGGGALTFYYSDGTTQAAPQTIGSSIFTGAEDFVLLSPGYTTNNARTDGINQGIVLKAATADFADGDGTAKLYIRYGIYSK